MPGYANEYNINFRGCDSRLELHIFAVATLDIENATTICFSTVFLFIIYFPQAHYLPDDVVCIASIRFTPTFLLSPFMPLKGAGQKRTILAIFAIPLSVNRNIQKQKRNWKF